MSVPPEVRHFSGFRADEMDEVGLAFLLLLNAKLTADLDLNFEVPIQDI